MAAIRERSRAIGLLIIGIVSAVLGAAALVDRPYQRGQVPLGIALVVVGVLSLLAARQGVDVEAHGVKLRYTLRSRFVPREQIVCFKVGDVRNRFGERLAKPVVLLQDGTTVPIPGADKVSLFSRNAYLNNFPVVDALEGWRRQGFSDRHRNR